ncbi:MAG: ribulose-phosphate 3-epimerase [Chloroflexaceae bacterium]|nr:ribulose-phosphate 3-epimerase [Chloroflexaceae bacterium]NJO05457.1 ribulose-phosphate 3-epimerase [Chloroflexaceae bacterium]
MTHILIAPSIIAADFGHLAEQVREAEAGGADWLHVDVMDGQFVPNITIGPFVVAALRSLTRLPLDVHLMIVQPERFIEDFVQAGASTLTVHIEATNHLHRTISSIKESGIRAGITLNPATPLTSLEPVLADVDLALVMSVNPGFSGQRYIPASTARIRKLRHMLDAIGSEATLEVDGGINMSNAREVVEAGATALVAASAIFNAKASVLDNIDSLRRTLYN